MKTIMYLAMGIGLGFLSARAGAEVLTLSPSVVAITASGDDGWARVALKFDLSGMREGTGRRIVRAHLEWQLTGVPTDEISEYYAHEITESWTQTGVQESAGNLTYAETPIDQWDIAPIDYARNGGFVRLDVTPLVEGWASGVKENNGVALLTRDMSAAGISGQLGNPRLVIGYSFHAAQ